LVQLRLKDPMDQKDPLVQEYQMHLHPYHLLVQLRLKDPMDQKDPLVQMDLSDLLL
jgi:hypothetical protein